GGRVARQCIVLVLIRAARWQRNLRNAACLVTGESGSVLVRKAVRVLMRISGQKSDLRRQQHGTWRGIFGDTALKVSLDVVCRVVDADGQSSAVFRQKLVEHGLID